MANGKDGREVNAKSAFDGTGGACTGEFTPSDDGSFSGDDGDFLENGTRCSREL